MKNSLKNGEKISFIFKDSGLNLKKIDFIILKTGEESGNLVKSFLIIEDRLKNRIKLKRKLKKILIYPEILLIFVLLIIIFLGKFILPNFVDMLNEMEITISKTTKWIIWFANNFLYIAALIITMIFILKKLKKINYIFFNFIFKFKIIKN